MTKLSRSAIAAGALSVLLLTNTAQAAFEGRNASGAVDNTCTSTGAGKCTMFYDTTLDITILNNWNIGSGLWSATAAAGSAQALAASAGLAATGLTGWVLPTGDGNLGQGAGNQYLSIWINSGSTFAALSAQFDSVQWGASYYSSTDYAADPGNPWVFDLPDGLPGNGGVDYAGYAVAVRPGDVALVPEPQAVALALAALGVRAVMRRKRPV